MLKLSLREAVSSPAMQFAVIEAWLTLPDWVTRRTEIVELEDASTASHTIVLDITLPNSLREKLTIYPQQSDAAAKARERALDADAPGGTQAPEEVEQTADGADGCCEEPPEGGMVLLPALFLRRGMPLPRLGITLGQDEIKGTYLPKELSDTLMQGVIALTNDRPVPGPHQVPIQRFECECPEAAWQCKRSSCPGRSEREEKLPNGDLKSCPPPTSPLRRYEWPYCPYAEEEDCTCVKERCPAATLTYPEVVGPEDRGLKAFLDSHLSTDYGMVIVAPESAVKGSFRLEITFTRELTKWDRPDEIKKLSEKRRLGEHALGLGSRWRRLGIKHPVARCGPFQGVVERASYPRSVFSSPFFWWRKTGKARCGLRQAAAQTDRLKTGWKKRQRFFHGKDSIRRMVANRGAAMTIGVQTSSLGDAGTFHFVFGAPKGMQITPSGGWIHDWPAWRRATLDEGIETMIEAEPKAAPGTARGYTDDFVPIDGKDGGSGNPAPYVAFLPARGIDEKVAMRPTPSDLLPLSPPSDTRGPTHRFSPGSSLLALIQFRPKTNLPFFGVVTNLLLLALILLLSLLSGEGREGAFISREDAWVSLFLLAPALLAGFAASREHPVAASLVLKYRLVLGITAALTLSVVLFLLATTSSPIDGEEHRPPVPSLFDGPGLEVATLWFFVGISLILLVFSAFHYLVNRAAHRWADDYSVNQLDLVSPSRGFKLDTMRRPWCDPSPIRPEQALEELEALRIRSMGFEATGGGSNGSVKGDAWHSGVDSLVFSSQELTSTFTESTDEEGNDQQGFTNAGVSDDEGQGRKGRPPRTREQLLEKYGVELPDYVPSETEMVFRDGRFFERKIHAALGNSDLSFVDLSPRHAQRAGGSDIGVLTPAAADDDLDRYLMTVMAMEAGVDVIAEGCLMGRYTPPLGDPVGSHWLELELKAASEAQLRRFTAVLKGSDEWTEVQQLLTVDGEDPGEPLPAEKVENSEVLLGWIRSKTDSQKVSHRQLYRLFTVLLRNGGWDAVCNRLGGNRSGDVSGGDWEEGWKELRKKRRENGPWKELSPLETVAGLPIRRFKGFPDLLIKKSLVEELVGSEYPLAYVPVDIKQANPFKTTEEPAPKAATIGLTEKISASSDHEVTLLADFPESVQERDQKPQYLAQLGLYSVLLKQAEKVLEVYPDRDSLPKTEDRSKATLSIPHMRRELKMFRKWITDEDDFARELAPMLPIDTEPSNAALWIARGDGDSSRILPIPWPFLARQLERAVWDLVNEQASVASSPELAGEPSV